MTGAAPHEGPHTWDDFVALGDEDKRELIDGDLVEVEVARPIHEHIVVTLSFHLKGWTRINGGSVLGSFYKIRISAKRGVMPDLQLYRRGNDAAFKQELGLVDGIPDLVVEIISTSSRRIDRVTKQRWYAGRGVPEYWIVDPEGKTLERLVLESDGHYKIADAAGEDDVFHPASFEGMVIPLAELWEP